MLRKDKYWVLKNEEMDIIVQLIQTHPSYRQLQEGSAINSIFAAMNKATEEKLATEQQPVDAEPEQEQQTYAQHRPMPAAPQPPRRGVAAKVSQTQPPVPPQPPQKKKPNFMTRKAAPEEVEESQEQEEESDEGNEVDQEDLVSDFSDEDF